MAQAAKKSLWEAQHHEFDEPCSSLHLGRLLSTQSYVSKEGGAVLFGVNLQSVQCRTMYLGCVGV